MCLLVRCGGLGCPHLREQLHLCLLVMFMAASYSCNEYAIAAAHYILPEPHPCSEGKLLLEAVHPMGCMSLSYVSPNAWICPSQSKRTFKLYWSPKS